MACCTDTPPITVTVEKPTFTQDAANSQIQTWSTYAKFGGCRVRGLRSREVVQGEQVQGETGWMIEIPYSTKAMGITGQMRCTFSYGRSVTAYCDGAAIPVGFKMTKVKAFEQTA